MFASPTLFLPAVAAKKNASLRSCLLRRQVSRLPAQRSGQSGNMDSLPAARRRPNKPTLKSGLTPLTTGGRSRPLFAPFGRSWSYGLRPCSRGFAPIFALRADLRPAAALPPRRVETAERGQRRRSGQNVFFLSSAGLRPCRLTPDGKEKKLPAHASFCPFPLLSFTGGAELGQGRVFRL